MTLHVYESDFPGFYHATWCQFITRLTEGKDATLVYV